MTTFVPAEPFPPGEYLQDELDARGWTHDDLASVLSMSRRQVINLIQGKSGITPDTAHALAEAFDQNAQTWMNLQVAYELAVAAQKERDVKRRARIFNKVPVRELRRRGWIPDVDSTDELEAAVRRLLRIDSIEKEVSVAVAARKSTSYKMDTNAQKAWYCRAREMAEHVGAAKYTKANLVSGMPDLLALSAYPEDARRVPKVLADMGIRFVVVQHLKKTHIDGVALWLNRTTPVVAVSLRYDRIDNFWFTLVHELIHIKYRDKSPVDVDVAATVGDKELPEMEQRANREAAQYLVPADKLESFVRRTGPLYYEPRIVQFAQARGRHPGIIVGQLQHRDELGCQQFRKLLAKVREEVISGAMADGWGITPAL